MPKRAPKNPQSTRKSFTSNLKHFFSRFHRPKPSMTQDLGPMIQFTVDSGVPVIAESDLQRYADSLGAVVLPAEPVPVTIPNVMVTKLCPTSDTKLVYVGIHHTFVHNPTPSAASTATATATTTSSASTNPVPATAPPTFVRGPTGFSSTGVAKLNSIFTHGIRPANNASRALLYGPGVYLTQRPALGNLAAAGGLLGLTADQQQSAEWEIVQVHVFVPFEEYRKWKVQEVKLVPDCDAFHKDEGMRKLREEMGMTNTDRRGWGLDDGDVVFARHRESAITTTSPSPSKSDCDGEKTALASVPPPNPHPPIEELILSSTAMANAKLLAQCIPHRERFLPYMSYRAKHRYDKREDIEWSEVAMQVLENGEVEEGVVPIEDTSTFKDLVVYRADFTTLERKEMPEGPRRYWREFEKFRERK